MEGHADLIVTIVCSVIGAVWLLRSKLSDIEKSLNGHVERTDARHHDHERRIIDLETYRNARR